MICEAIEIGNTYVANINVTITAPGRYKIVLDDLSPDSFLIEAGASGDGRFAINSDPGQPCPYSAIEFVFTVGEGYAFVSRGFFIDGARVKNSGWRFGPAIISGSQCSVTAQISADAGRFEDYVLFCQAVSQQPPTIFKVGPKVRVSATHSMANRDNDLRSGPITGDDDDVKRPITGDDDHSEGQITGDDDAKGPITGDEDHLEGQITGDDDDAKAQLPETMMRKVRLLVTTFDAS